MQLGTFPPSSSLFQYTTLYCNLWSCVCDLNFFLLLFQKYFPYKIEAYLAIKLWLFVNIYIFFLIIIVS